ncbi:hypothetical protein SH2C18_46200 [Clostridium sediminicola]|uniref:hypothetical protein n=1 Tax=Clostridium sediminicola TaxID=3114879 RepID=UPI0031F254B1
MKALLKKEIKSTGGGPQGEWEGEAKIDFVGNDENYDNFNYNFNLYEGENKNHI